MKKFLLSTAALMLVAGNAHAANIGIAMSLFDDNYLTSLRSAMETYAGSLDGVSVSSEDAQGDTARQQSQVDNFIAQGVDAIIVMLVDADSGAAISQQAANAGVPLIFVNNAPINVDTLPDKQGFVGSDEVQAGTLETTEICRRLNGQGNAVVLMGQLGTTGQRGRTQAVHEVLATDPCKGITIVEEQSANWQRTPALDLMTNWLSAGIEFDAVISNNDEMALGAIQSLKAAGKDMGTIVNGGVDATQDALAAIKSGDLDVTVFQNAKGQGEGAVDAAMKLINGEPLEKKIYIPFELVTMDNVSQYENRN